LPFSSFHSLTLFTGLCLSLSPTGQLLAADSTEKNSGETLVVEAQTPSLYAPTRSADPKFSRPIADTTRTVSVVSEQVMKDQGVTNLTDAEKRSRRRRFLCRRKRQLDDRRRIYMREPIPTAFTSTASAISAASAAIPLTPSRWK
jgi:outer membrane receptor for monomeric catechols